MNPTITTYTLYLLITLPLTVWVAKTLQKNGRIFLVDCFNKNEELADGVNHLLVVGFYLVNFGFVVLYLKLGQAVLGTQQIFEALSAKVGTVLLILGVMHFFNIYILNRFRKRRVMENAPPPQPPHGIVRTELPKAPVVPTAPETPKQG